MNERRPRLLDLMNNVTRADLEREVPSGSILAVDFYVRGIEAGTSLDWGFELGRIENIDHHASVPAMSRQVSSAGLALERLRQRGVARDDEFVVINHTDCDSVLSAAILLGLLAPSERLASAAIAADHTGAEDTIADLLQALDDLRDFELSLCSVRRLLEGLPLDACVNQKLAARLRRRDAAAQTVQTGRFSWIDSVAFAHLEEVIDGEFFPALLPDAAVIVVGHRKPEEAAKWLVKARLGLAAPQGASLHALRLKDFDQSFGGRWNAGSNKRGKGSHLSPGSYAEHIAQVLRTAGWGSGFSGLA